MVTIDPERGPTRAAPPDTLRDDVRVIGDLVGSVLREQGGAALLAHVEHIRQAAIALHSGTAASPNDSDGGEENQATRTSSAERDLRAWVAEQGDTDLGLLVRAFTVYFHLINVAEQHHRVRTLRDRERSGQGLHESIGAALHDLATRGIAADTLVAVLERLEFHPVFTAHPSEARRRTLLQHLEQAALAVAERDDPRLTPAERTAGLDELRRRITLIWQTAETRPTRPTVIDEVQSVISIVIDGLYVVAPRVQRTLESHLAHHFPGIAAPEGWLKLGTWVGGDRDGNPNVNADVTRAAVRLARNALLRRYRADIRDLGRDLSVAGRIAGADPALLASVERDRRELRVQPVAEWADEPYRRKCGLIAERLRRTLNDAPEGYRDPRLLLADLDLLDASLRAHHGTRIADGALRDLRTRVRVFGLHLAELEIRQHADRYAQAVDELLRLGTGAGLRDLDEAGRLAELESLLASAPLAVPAEALSAPTRDILETLRTMGALQEQFGPGACHTAIISMTQRASDILALLFLAREAGLFNWSPGQPADSQIDIVPLFEEVRELRACGAICDVLFQSPAYRASLAARGNYQQIMLGYSDSNKDAGYLAATWQTYQAQDDLARIAAREGLRLQIFHGRGGAVGRGGGPMSRAILARPNAARTADLKVTEQGEVIFARYGHPAIATRHLEQNIHALLLAALQDAGATPDPTWIAEMERLAETSRRAYSALVKETAGFLRFFRQATPFPELSTLNLASRPVSRSGQEPNHLGDLRAIPWGFSWAQARAFLPGWYGLGTALGATSDRGDLPLLQAMYQGWRPFASALDNAQRSLGVADMATFARYATLADDGPRFAAAIRAEFDRSVAVILAITEEVEILATAPLFARSIKLRNPYVDALHFAQIELLHRYRALPPDDPARPALLDAIHHSINGIAAGLQTTG